LNYCSDLSNDLDEITASCKATSETIALAVF
jgi:hypothetical protein